MHIIDVHVFSRMESRTLTEPKFDTPQGLVTFACSCSDYTNNIFDGGRVFSKSNAFSNDSSSIIDYSFASDGLVFCSTQVVILVTNASTSCLVLPACKHTRIRSEPSGTVGGTIGLTIKFFS
jgi:hypothetical protein